MSTAELKKKLIDRIQSTTDQELLLEATRLLEIQLDETEKPFQLTDEMNKAVEESKKQIKRGEFLNHDEANKEIDEWLEK